MAARPIFIADGHHRYETGLRYRDDLAAAGQLTGPDDPANFCMMMLVGMSDPGLLILPTHRLVSGLPRPDLRRARRAARVPSSKSGDVGQGERRLPRGLGARSRRAATRTARLRHGGRRRWLMARLRSDEAMDRLAPTTAPTGGPWA